MITVKVSQFSFSLVRQPLLKPSERELTRRKEALIIHTVNQRGPAMSSPYLLAQKQRYRITLEVNALNDFNPHQIDWKKVLELESNEKVKSYVEDLDCPDHW